VGQLPFLFLTETNKQALKKWELTLSFLMLHHYMHKALLITYI